MEVSAIDIGCFLDTVIKPYQSLWTGVIAIGLYFIKKWIERRSDRARISRALIAEAEGLLALYLQATNGGLKQTESFQLYWIPIGNDYATVYKSIAGRIGLFKPDEVEAIVKFYTEVVAFTDSLRFYSSESSFVREAFVSKCPIEMFVGKTIADVVIESGIPMKDMQDYYQMLCQQERELFVLLQKMKQHLAKYQ